MRTGISITLKPADSRRLKALVRDHNTLHKHVWRVEIVLLSADGIGTNEIMRRTGKSKTCVWRWQDRFMQEGYDGLVRDRPRPSRIPRLGSNFTERVVMLTLTDPPAEATRRCANGWPGIPLDLPLHAHIGIMAQRCRGLLRQAHKAAIEALHLPIGRRLAGSD